MAKQFQLYVEVIRWIDGDSFAGVLDLSTRFYLGTHAKPVRFRCAYIDAPEIDAPGGLGALKHAEEIAPPGTYECVSVGLDKYGRPLLDLVLKDRLLFSVAMVKAGHAAVY